MQKKADMSRCSEDVMTLKDKYMRTFSHSWTDIEFVQQPVGQLPSIEDIERELQGFDGGDV